MGWLPLDRRGQGQGRGTMFYNCLFSAACQREYLPAPLRPTEDREAGTVEREGVLGHRLAGPSKVTLLFFFFF